MNLLISLSILLIGIELFLKPRLDYTREKKLLLWYGRKVRNYIVLL